jgi:hypothetical protein
MRQKFSLFMTLFAWLLATGSHWDLVQTFAWGRMFANYSLQMSLTQAVEETFNPDKPCEVCRAVEHAKQQEERNALPGGKALEKILLVFQPAPAVVIARLGDERWTLADRTAPSAEQPPPLLPPPRALSA